MKTYILCLFVIFAMILSSCEHNVFMETTVHDDGRVDKVISVEADSKTDWKQKVISSNALRSWKVDMKEIDTAKSTEKNRKKFVITFKKSFGSVIEANADLATPNDTLFRVTSTFEKKFRWFYTYLYYADTYHAINRMPYPYDDYFTSEDYAFIDRLPSEGSRISKADSLYMGELERKIFDIYGVRAVFESYYDAHLKLIKEYELEDRWTDTLRKHKENIFALASAKKDVEDNFILNIMDSLHIPLPYKELSNYPPLTKGVERNVEFISWANEGKYIHQISMPWQIVRSNGDSVVGNTVVWSPPVMKFLLRDYTMYAEARTMNYTAVLISVVLIGITVFIFLRRRK